MGPGPLRRAARTAAGLVLRPAGEAFFRLWRASRSWPRRVPDLERLTRRASFRPLQSAAAVWADRSFELIEDGAPWLDRAGRWVADHCVTGLNSRALSFPRDPPSVTCHREVTLVYGFDGGLQDRLAELAAVLGAAGWSYLRGGLADPVRNLRDSEPPAWPLHWAPAAGLGRPAGLETMPPHRELATERWMEMGIGWASRDRPARLVTTREHPRPGDPRTATATCQPVQVGGADLDQLAAMALAAHQHAIAIRIKIVYYLNANVNARPGRLRKSLLPARR